jgi:hypothetical protein
VQSGAVPTALNGFTAIGNLGVAPMGLSFFGMVWLVLNEREIYPFIQA